MGVKIIKSEKGSSKHYTSIGLTKFYVVFLERSWSVFLVLYAPVLQYYKEYRRKYLAKSRINRNLHEIGTHPKPGCDVVDDERNV